MRFAPFAAAVSLALLTCNSVQAGPGLISVDLQSSWSADEGTAFSGVESGAAAANAAFAAANIWNDLGTTGNVTNYSSGVLVDSTGVTTTAAFSITGITSAYGSPLFSTDTLLRDYFYWGTRSTSSAIDWQISGLAASTSYAFYTYGSFSDAIVPRTYSMLVDTDGDGLLTDESAATVSSTVAATGVLTYVMTDSQGLLRGRNTAPDDPTSAGFFLEANWAGFQIAQVQPPGSVPEPASLALLSAGLLGLGLVRRRQT